MMFSCFAFSLTIRQENKLLLTSLLSLYLGHIACRDVGT